MERVNFCYYSILREDSNSVFCCMRVPGIIVIPMFVLIYAEVYVFNMDNYKYSIIDYTTGIHTHTNMYIYIYVYIYMCVCVCVCVHLVYIYCENYKLS